MSSVDLLRDLGTEACIQAGAGCRGSSFAAAHHPVTTLLGRPVDPAELSRDALSSVSQPQVVLIVLVVI